MPYLSHVFQGPGFSWIQVFQGSGFSGSRFFKVRVQGPGPDFRSILKEVFHEVFYKVCQNLYVFTFDTTSVVGRQPRL